MSSDTPSEGPLSIDDVLDQMEAAPAIPSEEENEAEQPEEVVEQAEAETEEVEAEAEPDEQDEPEAEDAEPVEVYDADEYGEIAIALKDGTQTTLAELTKGNLRQADYSRKTQELAEQRKALEAGAQKLAERERQIDQKLASVEVQEPDWAKEAEEDPLGWQLKKINWDKEQLARKEAQAAEKQKQEQLEARFRQMTVEKVLEVIPEWNDGEAFKKGAAARRQTALDAGFHPAEYDGARDMRLAVLLEWAAKGRAAEQKVQATTKKLSKVPKVIKPGASTTKADKAQAEASARKKRRNGPMDINEYLSTFDLK